KARWSRFARGTTTSGASRIACSIPSSPGRRFAERRAHRSAGADMNIIKMTSLELSGKRVLIREDLNVPLKDGTVTSDARIRAALPTIQLALKSNARVLLMSHLARPEEGK